MSGKIITSSGVGSNTGLDATTQPGATTTGASQEVSDGSTSSTTTTAGASAGGASTAGVSYDARAADEALALSVYELGLPLGTNRLADGAVTGVKIDGETITPDKFARGATRRDVNVCSWGPAIQGRDKSLALPDRRVAAYAGDTIAQCLARFQSGGAIHTHAQTADEPHVGFTMIGTNSLYAGMSGADALAELDLVLAEQATLLPGMYRVLLTIPKLYSPAAPTGGLVAANTQIDYYNTGLLERANRDERIGVIDVSSALAQSHFAVDGVHLTPAGMSVLGEMVADEFMNMFPGALTSEWPSVVRCAFFGDSNTATGGGYAPGGYRPAFFNRLVDRRLPPPHPSKAAFSSLTPTTDCVVVTDTGFELTAESCAILVELQPKSYVASTNAVVQCTPTGQNYSKGWLLAFEGTSKTINLYLKSAGAAVSAKFPDELIGTPCWILGHADRDAGVASIYAAWFSPSGEFMWGCLGQATGVTPWAAGDASGVLRVGKNENFAGVGGLYRRIEFSRGADVPSVDQIASYFRAAVDGQPIPGLSASMSLDEGTGTTPATASGAVGTLTGGWSSAGSIMWPGEEIGGAPLLLAGGREWEFSDDARVTHLFDATDRGAISVSVSSVTAWSSSIGLCTAAQGTGSKQPTYNATGINGRPSIDFDGSADFMSLSSYTAPLADRIIVAVVNPSDLSTGRWLLDFDVGRTIVAVNESSIGNQIGYYGAGWADSGVAATTGVQILTWEFRAGTTKFYKNGVLLATDAVNAVATALGGVAAAIGSNNGGTSGFFAGKLGLLAIANGKVDDALRIRMERKAAAMFGLPITN